MHPGWYLSGCGVGAVAGADAEVGEVLGVDPGAGAGEGATLPLRVVAYGIHLFIFLERAEECMEFIYLSIDL